MIARMALCEAVRLSLDSRPLTLIAAPPVSGKSTLVGQVVGDLRARGRPVSTSLQDTCEITVLQRIDRLDAAEHAVAVAAIERRIGDGGRVLVTSEQPVFDAFALLRLRDQMREFGAAEMALRPEEIPAFLGDGFAEVRISRPIRALLERTEGWIAAWNIIRELLQRGRSLSELAAGFSGADPDIARYFDRLVMPACDDDVARFLLQVGPIDRVSAGLADTLTGRSDGLALLERATRQCAFVFADRASEWFRPHRLFRDYLRHRGERDDIRGLQRTFRQAAAWRVERADWLGAARLYLDAGQPEAATEILSRHTEELITGKGEILPYRELVASLSRDGYQPPALASELALGSIFAGDFAGASALLERLTPQIDSLPPDESARLESMWIAVDYGLERFDRVIAAAPRWLARHAKLDPRVKATVAQSLFWSYLAQLDSAGSYRALAIARAETAKIPSPFLESWLCLAGSVHKWEHGQVLGADSLLAGVVGEGVIGHTLNLVRAAVAWEQGHVARAHHLIAESLREGVKHSVVETALLGWETAAKVAFHDAGLAEALAVLQDAESVMAARHGERGRRLARLARGKLLLQSPAEWRGANLGVELNIISGEAVALGHCRSLGELAKLTLARFQALNGNPKPAVSLLQPIIVNALQQSRLRVWTEASMIYAGALARMGEPDRAARVAWQAAEQVCAGGVGATIWEEGVLLAPIMDDLVGRATIAGGPRDAGAAAIILALARRAGRTPSWPAPGAATETGAVVKLTEVERRIIALVAQGLSNRDVAERLLVRESTVKWHMHNVFGKLDVRSRTGALAEVRRLGLI